MTSHPLVSIITPTANRPEMLERCIKMFLAQDWPNKEMVIINTGEWNSINHNTHPDIYIYKYGEWYVRDQFRLIGMHGTIGAKQNEGIRHASGNILLHMNDDDLYAPNYITRSVTHLLSSGAEITGLSSAYFYDTTKKQTYELRQDPKAQLVLCGATLCYHRRAWERKKFPDTNYGEDMAFIQNNGRYECHGYKEGFTAIVHGNNTVCHKSLPLMHKVNTTPQLVLDWMPR